MMARIDEANGPTWKHAAARAQILAFNPDIDGDSAFLVRASYLWHR